MTNETITTLQSQLTEAQAKVRELEKDAARWKMLAHMESAKAAPETLREYIARPAYLDGAIDIFNSNAALAKETP